MKKKCQTGAKVPAINDSWTARQKDVLNKIVKPSLCKGGKVKKGT